MYIYYICQETWQEKKLSKLFQRDFVPCYTLKEKKCENRLSREKFTTFATFSCRDNLFCGSSRHLAFATLNLSEKKVSS